MSFWTSLLFVSIYLFIPTLSDPAEEVREDSWGGKKENQPGMENSSVIFWPLPCQSSLMQCNWHCAERSGLSSCFISYCGVIAFTGMRFRYASNVTHHDTTQCVWVCNECFVVHNYCNWLCQWIPLQCSRLKCKLTLCLEMMCQLKYLACDILFSFENVCIVL